MSKLATFEAKYPIGVDITNSWQFLTDRSGITASNYCPDHPNNKTWILHGWKLSCCMEGNTGLCKKRALENVMFEAESLAHDRDVMQKQIKRLEQEITDLKKVIYKKNTKRRKVAPSPLIGDLMTAHTYILETK
jgi:hypothetical protein